MRRSRVLPPFALVAVLVLLAACGSDDTTPSTSGPTDTSVTTASTVTTSLAPTTTSTTETPRVEETVFGFLRSFDGTDGPSVLVGVDEAEMLTGDDAIAAAREDGVIGEDEGLPNDFYIRNLDEATVELTVSPSVVVTLQACYVGGDCVTTEQVDLATWSVLLGSEDDPGLAWDWYGAGSLPYEFTIENGLVVGIREQYLP